MNTRATSGRSPATGRPSSTGRPLSWARLLRLGAATVLCVAIGLWAVWKSAPQVLVGLKNEGRFVPVARRVQVKSLSARAIIQSAKAQIGTRYDAAFRLISYPMGDVPANRGACTDVIVRSLRAGGLDLQRAIHEDMARRFKQYPQKWGEKAPNPSIDHRRVPNQIAYFQSHAQVLPARADDYSSWQPGDIVYWDTGAGRQHTGIISDGVDENGQPFVIHNGGVCIEDHALARWPIIAHFRWPARNSQ